MTEPTTYQNVMRMLDQVGIELAAVPFGAAHPTELLAIHILRDAVALLAESVVMADERCAADVYERGGMMSTRPDMWVTCNLPIEQLDGQWVHVLATLRSRSIGHQAVPTETKEVAP